MRTSVAIGSLDWFLDPAKLPDWDTEIRNPAKEPVASKGDARSEPRSPLNQNGCRLEFARSFTQGDRLSDIPTIRQDSATCKKNWSAVRRGKSPDCRVASPTVLARLPKPHRVQFQRRAHSIAQDRCHEMARSLRTGRHRRHLAEGTVRDFRLWSQVRACTDIDHTSCWLSLSCLN